MLDLESNTTGIRAGGEEIGVFGVRTPTDVVIDVAAPLAAVGDARGVVTGVVTEFMPACSGDGAGEWTANDTASDVGVGARGELAGRAEAPVAAT
jgi:hypothetical protein